MFEVKAKDVWGFWHFVSNHKSEFGAAMKAHNYARKTGRKTKVVQTARKTRIN